MTLNIKPLAEISEQAIHALCAAIGVADTFRFLSQFSTGSGDYTREKESLLAGLTMSDIVKEIREKRTASK